MIRSPLNNPTCTVGRIPGAGQASTVKSWVSNRGHLSPSCSYGRGEPSRKQRQGKAPKRNTDGQREIGYAGSNRLPVRHTQHLYPELGRSQILPGTQRSLA